jgi:regulator of protease activity HflC (stomatin/prohibitin superfamily)
VDVRIEYEVKPEHAPVVVAKLGDDEEDRFRNALNSAVRAIFRNNAETVRALDYVQQRSNQEQQSLQMLAEEMARFGVTVTAVRIGNVGDEKTLGNLLKTQTDREIAKQEQLTFQEQQKAAEQKKLLSRATQESEEEKRLATAAYAAKIADEEKKKRLIEAEAEAQSIAIKAKAQADAYQLIALQIGKSNAAMIEILKIVGERNIQITPRVMIGGGAGSGGNAGDQAGTALFGTMLDTMVSRDEEKPPPARTP